MDTVGGNVNWYSHYGKQYGCSSKKLKIELPYDPAIPLLSIYPNKNTNSKDFTCTRPVYAVSLIERPIFSPLYILVSFVID